LVAADAVTADVTEAPGGAAGDVEVVAGNAICELLDDASALSSGEMTTDVSSAGVVASAIVALVDDRDSEDSGDTPCFGRIIGDSETLPVLALPSLPL
jgi:hypothetical protein